MKTAHKLALAAAIAATILAPTAFAEVLPTGGHEDSRIKTVAYDPNDVVKLVGRYGFSTIIEFADGETINDVALGDTLAWEVAPSKSNLFVKPREPHAATNMTVITDRHIYQFLLQAAPHRNAPAHAFFAVKFIYPADESAKKLATTDAARARQALDGSLPKPSNYNYWACGAAQLRPTEAFDDGRFTYLRFPGAQEVPAVFVINSDNTESLANGQMRGDLYVVYTTARKFVLRKGNAVACLENRSFNWYGVGTPNGTTSPKVERTIKSTPTSATAVPSQALPPGQPASPPPPAPQRMSLELPPGLAMPPMNLPNIGTPAVDAGGPAH
ncbi:MAG: P-type conjugative transfer protein VirB9 [Nitrospira sp.]|nr:P-type conjugative transfer protein VirB9 [Nitrospira sp.]MBS0194377.1 P-type conjugative transfer protein VirB9 [Pseudomonadota bacterium]